MPTFVDTLPVPAGEIAEPQLPAARKSVPGIQFNVTEGKRDHLLSTILTTSVCLHLLLVGYLGFGVPTPPARPRVARAAPPPPPIVENIELQAPPPPPKAQPQALRDEPPPSQDLPAAVSAVAAVPANVAVAFAIKVAGPVRLVADAADASGGGVVAPVAAIPHEVVGRNLLTPQLSYPAAALYKHLTGRVVVEFHTTATGDIIDIKVRTSSGEQILDQAALDNLRLGRWVGEAGYFTKTYDFILR
jgi:protein TonB